MMITCEDHNSAGLPDLLLWSWGAGPDEARASNNDVINTNKSSKFNDISYFVK